MSEQAEQKEAATSVASRPPFPPFTLESAVKKVRATENAWNMRDPQSVALEYTPDTRCRVRGLPVNGRSEIESILTRKWKKELDYRLIKELWTFADDRISVRFSNEWHDDQGKWFRSFGNENWWFDENGLMRTMHVSSNDVPIDESERLFRWPQGLRPEDHPGLSDLGL